MESLSYAGWTIKTQEADKGIGAVMTDPWGNIFHQSTINWPSHQSARLYAQKFIDWHTKFEQQRSAHEHT